MLDEQGVQWVRGTVRSIMVKRRVTYAQLVERLAAIGVVENERGLRNKVARGVFSAVFFVQCLEALGVDTLKIDMVETMATPEKNREFAKWTAEKMTPKEEREMEATLASIHRIVDQQDSE